MAEFNLDERIDTAAGLRFVRPDDIEAAREPYKQLIADVLEYVKPEKTLEVHLHQDADVDAYIKKGHTGAVIWMEAKQKELGL